MVFSGFTKNNEMEIVKSPPMKVKHYMFMLRSEDHVLHVNIMAPDRAVAEKSYMLSIPVIMHSFYGSIMLIPRSMRE
jgi:hypothetical protein